MPFRLDLMSSISELDTGHWEDKMETLPFHPVASIQQQTKKGGSHFFKILPFAMLESV